MTKEDKIRLCGNFSLKDKPTIKYIKEELIPWLYAQINEINELISLIGNEDFLLKNLEEINGALKQAENRLLLVL